jgi:hypothetical protein
LKPEQESKAKGILDSDEQCTGGSDDRVDVGMLLQRVHALLLVQVEADALLYQMVNLKQHQEQPQGRPISFDAYSYIKFYIYIYIHTILM